jgi:phospholipid transport system substrate-binding protein
MGDSALKAPARAAERRRTLRTWTEKALDVQESARRSLGPHWDALTPAERDRFVRLFAELIDHAYLTRLAVDGEKIVLLGEAVDGADTVVKGRVLAKSGASTPVDFYLHLGGDGGWRVYDVAFEGMSLVGNYRAQFNKIIRASSFDQLVALLEAKTRADAQEKPGEPLQIAP